MALDCSPRLERRVLSVGTRPRLVRPFQRAATIVASWAVPAERAKSVRLRAVRSNASFERRRRKTSLPPSEIRRSPEATREAAGDRRYAEEAHPGGSMRSSPEKRGRISRWWNRVQWRRLLKRNRASGKDRLGRSRRHHRVTVEDLYPNVENENEE